jgi:hypothetical protein
MRQSRHSWRQIRRLPKPYYTPAVFIVKSDLKQFGWQKGVSSGGLIRVL